MNDEKTIEITASLKMVEELVYTFDARVRVPVSVADDPQALTEYLAAHEELWSDQVQGSEGKTVDLSESPLSKGKWIKVLPRGTS
ncbi:hypothetical protein IAG44_39985 [Streptomyces roseirectus]|uniref:Uncharacterized protein n=1 Tax=Streptomyces roseirectus TaxID=2768066 RepID=A0A7H0IQC7_9ACTN|nr:hypothetical protein [Streptomyces roseirectus]QNP74993.1 hypothetical protein IAG44_39985 [Streptomyces roseirectus]